MGTIAFVAGEKGHRRADNLDELATILRAEQVIVWIDTDEKTESIESFLLSSLGIHGVDWFP